MFNNFTTIAQAVTRMGERHAQWQISYNLASSNQNSPSFCPIGDEQVEEQSSDAIQLLTNQIAKQCRHKTWRWD